MEMERINLTIPSSAKTKLQAMAEKQGCSVQDVIRDAIKSGFLEELLINDGYTIEAVKNGDRKFLADSKMRVSLSWPKK